MLMIKTNLDTDTGLPLFPFLTADEPFHVAFIFRNFIDYFKFRRLTGLLWVLFNCKKVI